MGFTAWFSHSWGLWDFMGMFIGSPVEMGWKGHWTKRNRYCNCLGWWSFRGVETSIQIKMKHFHQWDWTMQLWICSTILGRVYEYVINHQLIFQIVETTLICWWLINLISSPKWGYCTSLITGGPWGFNRWSKLCIQARSHTGSPSDPLQLAEMNDIDALNIDKYGEFHQFNLHFNTSG